MTLRRTLATRLAALTVLFAFLAAGLAALTSWRGFATVEASEADRDAERVVQAIAREAEQLSLVTEDWSYWDDTLAYVHGEDPHYETANLVAETFEILELSDLVIAAGDGRIIWSGGHRPGEDALAPADPAILRDVAPGRDLHLDELGDGTVGIRRTTRGLSLVASQPITDSRGAAPVAGSFVMAREVDSAFLAGLAERVQRELALEPPDATRPERITTAEATVSHVPLRGEDGTTLAVLAVTSPRTVTAVGRNSILTMVATIVALLLVMGTVTLVTVDRIVVRRLLRLRDDSATIERHGTGQVQEDDAGDELSQVTQAVNRMLVALQRTRQDLEQRNAELTELADLRRNLVAVVSHELRTPLTTIQGFSLTLDRHGDELDAVRREHLLARIVANAEHVSRILGDLLVLSRADEGQVHVEPHDVDLSALVADLGHDLPFAFSATVPDDIRVWCDPDHLRRMLSNLLENAAKYGVPPIEVVAEARADRVHVQVRDAGPGVPDEFAARMFDRFTQASTGNCRTATGVGLGLSIVHLLAEANGGRVEYVPTPEGAVLVMELPAAHRLALASTAGGHARS